MSRDNEQPQMNDVVNTEQGSIPPRMDDVVNRPVLNSAKYEAVTVFISTVVGALGVPFYLEATAKAGWEDKASSIAANVLGIILFTKGSLDYLYGLIEKKEYAKATGIVVAAAVLYSPQVLIAIMESNASLGWTIFAAVATGLSGSFTSAYAVSQLPDMYQSAKASLTETFCSTAEPEQKTNKENILANLRLFLNRLRVSNYAALLGREDITDMTRQELLDLALKLAKTAPQPCVKDPGCLPGVARGILGSNFVALLLFGTLFSYGCGTEQSLRQDFKAPSMVAFLATFVLLSFQYLLNVTGGFSVARGVVDTLSLPNYKRVLPNEKTVGGTAGLVLSIAAPILGVASAAFSGQPTFEFSKTCDASVVQPGLSFINHALTTVMPFMPHDDRAFGHLADYSSRFFNAIFAAKFFYWVHTFGVERFGSIEDRNYLYVKNELEKLIALVERTPAEAVSELFTPDRTVRVGVAVRFSGNTEAEDDAYSPQNNAESLVVRVDDDDARDTVVTPEVRVTFDALRQKNSDFRDSIFSAPREEQQPVSGAASTMDTLEVRTEIDENESTLEQGLLKQ